jgi:hypothetical protein
MGNLAENPFLNGHLSKLHSTFAEEIGKKSLRESRTNKNLVNRAKIMVSKKLELVFIDKEGKWFPLDEVDREDLAQGLEKISKEVAKRLQLLKEQR